MRAKPNQSNGQPSGLKPLVAYIAATNKSEVAQILQNERFDRNIDRKPTKEVAEDIMSFLGKEKRKGNFLNSIKKVLNAHPDKDLILEMFGKPLPQTTKQTNANEYNTYDTANAHKTTDYDAWDTTGAETPKIPLLQNPLVKIGILSIVLVVLIIILLNFTD